MDEIIDISRLCDLNNYSVTTVFQPRWDNVLLMTPYDRKRTYILTIDGEELILEQRLQEVLRNFGEFAGVHQIEMQTLYSIVKGQTMGIIAGHYELVPTCGRGNCWVAYYMAHHVDHYQRNQGNNGVLITFKCRSQKLITVAVGTCMKTFERLLHQAHEVGKIQLESVKNLCNSFGIGNNEVGRFTCETTDHEQFLHRKQYERVFMDQILKVVGQTADRCYGEDFTADFYKQLRRILARY